MSKFNVGDKLVRLTNCYGTWGNQLIPEGHVGVVTSINGNWLSVDGIKYKGDDNPFHETHFKLIEEKQMFDFKNTPWVIYVQSKEEALAAYEWLKKESGLDFSVWVGSAFEDAKYNTGSIGFTNRVNHSRYMGGFLRFGELEGDLGRKVIKLSFKTETTITNIEFPEILTEKEIETKKIREEMEALAERLKKLENS